MTLNDVIARLKSHARPRISHRTALACTIAVAALGTAMYLRSSQGAQLHSNGARGGLSYHTQAEEAWQLQQAKSHLIRSLNAVRVRCTYASCQEAEKWVDPARSEATWRALKSLSRESVNLLRLDPQTSVAWSSPSGDANAALRCVVLQNAELRALGCPSLTDSQTMLVRELAGSTANVAKQPSPVPRRLTPRRLTPRSVNVAARHRRAHAS